MHIVTLCFLFTAICLKTFVASVDKCYACYDDCSHPTIVRCEKSRNDECMAILPESELLEAQRGCAGKAIIEMCKHGSTALKCKFCNTSLCNDWYVNTNLVESKSSPDPKPQFTSHWFILLDVLLYTLFHL